MQRAARQLTLFPDGAEAGNEPDFSVRESHRARRLSIKVFPRGRVEVVVPRRTRAADVEAFVAEHRDWIDSTRASFAKDFPPEPFRLPDAIRLPAIDARYRVGYEPESVASGVRCSAGAGDIVLRGRTGDEQLCVQALKRWLSRTAKAEFGPRLRSLSALTGSPYRCVQVRGQRTCWGSHSARGTISLNYCLLFVAPELLRYLMIHELCHAEHMNHSTRFWRHVRRFEPDYRRLDRALGDAWSEIPIWLGFN